jgi:3-oxoacyl-[acyl-carrier-protein] synthase II
MSRNPVVITGIARVSGAEVPASGSRRIARFAQLALTAAQRLLADCRMPDGVIDPQRTGVVIGSQFGGFEELRSQHERLELRGPERVSALLIPKSIVNSAASCITEHFHLCGPSLGCSTGAVSGFSAVAEAVMLIHSGLVDMVIAGGAEGIAVPDGDGQDSASGPDIAGLLLLESRESAINRGATALAGLEVAECGFDAAPRQAPSDGISRYPEEAVHDGQQAVLRVLKAANPRATLVLETCHADSAVILVSGICPTGYRLQLRLGPILL